jgi:hypothetical protein
MPQQDVQAIEWMHRMLAVAEWPIPRLYLAALLALNGNEAEARESVKKYLSRKNIEVRSIRALEACIPGGNPYRFRTSFCRVSVICPPFSLACPHAARGSFVLTEPSVKFLSGRTSTAPRARR